jgi:hypothetical protein
MFGTGILMKELNIEDIMMYLLLETKQIWGYIHLFILK